MKVSDSNFGENHIKYSRDNDYLLDMNFDDLTLKDAKQIFTELQKHQMELQKQNQELNKKHHDFELAREKYLNLINNAPLGFVTLSEKAIITEINSTAAGYFGGDASILLNLPITSFILIEDLSVFELNLKLVFATEEQQEFDLRLLRKNNEVCWTHVKLVIIRSNDGIKNCNAIIDGKNEHKRTEAILKESLLKWQQIFNGIGDSVCLLDNDGKILQANKKTRELLKKTESEILGHICYEVVHGLNEAITDCPFQRTKISKQRETFTMQFNSKWMEVIVDPLLNDQGIMIGAVHIMSDITERLRVGEALKESEEKFKTIFEEALDGILISDIDSRKCISANKMICKMLRFNGDEINDILIDSLFKEENIINSLRLTEKSDANDIRKLINAQVKRKDGSVFFADINSSFVKIKGKHFLLSIFRDITHRAEIEQELKDAKERFELIFNSGPDAILITRIEDGFYYDSNETFRKYTGYSREDLRGKSTLDIDIWKNPSDRDKLMQTLSETGKCQNLELQVCNKDGSERTVIMSAEIIPINGVQYLLSISREITERKAMEDMLRQSEARYRLITENANDVILVFSVPEQKLTYISPSIENLSGFTADEVMQMDLKDIHPIESYNYLFSDIDLRIKEISKGNNSNRSKSYELQLICKDNSLLWTELSTSFNINENNEVVEMIGVSRNISERKTIEEKIKQNEIRLASLLKISQSNYKTDEELLNFSIDEAINLTASKFGYFFYYSEHQKEFTLLSWSSQAVKECTVLLPETVYQLEKTGLWGEAVRQRKPILINNFKEENSLKKGYPKGHVELERFLTVPVIIEEKIVGVIGVANKSVDYNETDVIHLTLLMDEVWKVMQRNDLENLLTEKNKELHNLITTKDRFFSVVAHDLKNPFNVIIGFSELMMNDNKKNSVENLKKYASYIHSASQQAFNLLINLLEWSSAERGSMQFNPELFAIEKFLNETLKILSTSYIDKKITVNINIQPGLYVYADKNMLGIIIRNLISNAIKYTHVNGNIDIDVNESNDEFMFTITDNGIGIPKEDLDKLFKPEIQHTTIGTNNEKGTGLGLLLCRDFVIKHKGRIWAESEFGKGSVFHFALPKIPKSTSKSIPSD
jgi:PAS domain S-box-containing protein